MDGLEAVDFIKVYRVWSGNIIIPVLRDLDEDEACYCE